MATFCYVCDSTGDAFEEQYPCGQAPLVIERGGLVFHRDLIAEHGRRRARTACPGKDGVWQRSASNGIMGTTATLRAAKELDRKLGVPINYHEEAPGRWTAEFDSREHKNRWLRAHKRVDLDAGYSDPVPGEFRNSVPGEFER